MQERVYLSTSLPAREDLETRPCHPSCAFYPNDTGTEYQNKALVMHHERGMRVDNAMALR